LDGDFYIGKYFREEGIPIVGTCNDFNDRNINSGLGIGLVIFGIFQNIIPNLGCNVVFKNLHGVGTWELLS
jgi:hypothetical protein